MEEFEKKNILLLIVKTLNKSTGQLRLSTCMDTIVFLSATFPTQMINDLIIPITQTNLSDTHKAETMPRPETRSTLNSSHSIYSRRDSLLSTTVTPQ